MDPKCFYNPAVGDIVVGVVTQKFPEAWKVNIRAANEAYLPTTAFVHATKQHFPALSVGSIVIVGVASTHKDYDIELTGICAEDPKGWSTEETYLGELRGGLAFDVPLSYSQVLLDKECLMLTEIGIRLPYEIAVGVNGRVWVRSDSVKRTVDIVNVIKEGENITGLDELERLVENLS